MSGYDLLNQEWVDDCKRRHVCVNGMWFTIHDPGNFVDWLERTTKTKFDEFRRLSIPDRTTVFLRWKHGLNDASNVAVEMTDRSDIELIKRSDFSRNAPEYRFWASNKLRFHRRCQKVRQMIGISDIKLDDQTEQAVNRFGGRVLYAESIARSVKERKEVNNVYKGQE